MSDREQTWIDHETAQEPSETDANRLAYQVATMQVAQAKVELERAEKALVKAAEKAEKARERLDRWCEIAEVGAAKVAQQNTAERWL